MEFANKLRQMCPCGYQVQGVIQDQAKHENCVYNVKWSDLAKKYPEQESLVKKLWSLTLAGPDYSTSPTASALWELTECLGNDRNSIKKPLTPMDFLVWLPRPRSEELTAAAKDPDVLAFCEVMRYY
jgi:hypothetical protein